MRRFLIVYPGNYPPRVLDEDPIVGLSVAESKLKQVMTKEKIWDAYLIELPYKEDEEV